ncbi:MAG: DUF2953 domain-containing protein [Clostridium sp.]|jgi:hypothetical protein|nr:DUF2953 domain-containing protein [Clostridium sp.]
MTRFFFIIILTALAIIILLSKINFVIEYKKRTKDDVFVLSFFLYKGLLKYKYEIPRIDTKRKGIFYSFAKKTDGKKERKNIKYTGILERIERGRDFYLKHRCLIKKINKFLRCKITLKNLSFDMNFGTGNACQTSVLTGLLWTFWGIIISFLYRYIKVEKKHIAIKPNYSEKNINIDFYCIFNVRIVYIIVIGFMILTHFAKNRLTLFKAGKKAEKCVSG